MKLSRRDLIKITSGLALAGLRRGAADNLVPAQQISSAAGLDAAAFTDGSYEITVRRLGWTFGGAIGRSITSISVSDGTDALGAWQQIDLTYDPLRTSSIRLYATKATALFSTTCAMMPSMPETISTRLHFPNLRCARTILVAR